MVKGCSTRTKKPATPRGIAGMPFTEPMPGKISCGSGLGAAGPEATTTRSRQPRRRMAREHSDWDSHSRQTPVRHRWLCLPEGILPLLIFPSFPPRPQSPWKGSAPLRFSGTSVWLAFFVGGVMRPLPGIRRWRTPTGSGTADIAPTPLRAAAPNRHFISKQPPRACFRFMCGNPCHFR